MSVNNYTQMQNALYPAPSAIPQPTLKNAIGIIDAYGTTVPVDGTAGYITGATFKKSNGGANTSLYVNEGSVTSSDFNAAIADVPVAYGSAAGRGPSQAVWENCPVLDFMLDNTQGWVFYDDFIITAPVLAAAQAVTVQNNWASCTDGTAGSTLTPQLDAREGEVLLECTTIDEDIIMSALNARHTTGQVTFEAGKKTWFEARVKVLNVTDAKSAVFCGFAEEGLVVNGTLLDTDQAIVDKDFVCFAQLPADGDAWMTRHNLASGAAGVNGVAVSATAGVIVTDIYSKLGMYFDGTTLRFYIDGVELADKALLSDTDFPVGQEMAFYLALGNVDGADTKCSIDWVKVAQEF